jgi:hypothetical protein
MKKNTNKGVGFPGTKELEKKIKTLIENGEENLT